MHMSNHKKHIMLKQNSSGFHFWIPIWTTYFASYLFFIQNKLLNKSPYF